MKTPFALLALFAISSFTFGAQSVDVIMAKGSVPGGTGGQSVAFIGPPSGIPGGNYAYVIATNPNQNPGQQCLVSGDTAVLSVGTIGLAALGTQTGISNTGDIVGTATNGVGGPTVLFTKDLGILATIGTAAPGFPGNFYRSIQRPEMAANGTVFWVSSLSSTIGGAEVNRVLYCRSASGPIVPLVNTSSNLLGFPHVNAASLLISFDISPNGSNYVTRHSLVIGGISRQVVVQNGVTELARTGTLVPGNPGSYSDFSLMNINNSGQWAARYVAASPLSGGLTTGGEAITGNSSLDGVALSGTAPDAVSINNDGFVAALWPGEPEVLAIHRIGMLGAGRIIAKEFDPIDLDGDWQPDAVLLDIQADNTDQHSMQLFENKSIVVRARYQLYLGGGEVEAMVRFKLPILGDANKDNEVGPADFSLLALSFGSFAGDPNWDADCDFNWDGEIGPADFSILASEFGNFGP